MTEVNVCVLGDVTFDLVPVIAVVANFFAVAANRQQSLKQFFAGERCFQLFHTVRQCALQLDNTRTNVNSGLQFLRVKRFGDIIIGARFEALDQIVRAAP